MTLRFSEGFWTQRNPAVDAAANDAVSLPQELTSRRTRDRDVKEQACADCVPLTQIPSDCCVYLPENYEPNYAYPLIVWLHGAGGTERDLLDVMPQISTQNFIGLGLRGPVSCEESSSRYTWPQWDASMSDVEERLRETVCQLRREYHIHSERIFPAGLDEGASMAVRLVLDRPEWFGGAIAYACRFPGKQRALARFRDLPGKRILIGSGSRDRLSSPTSAIHLGRLLHSTGMEVAMRMYRAGHEPPAELFRDVNQWIMDGIYAANEA